MKLNKKGFTLVELLAVIAILAILVIIAMPNVLQLFSDAKKNTFVDEVQIIYKNAQQQFLTDSLGGSSAAKTYTTEVISPATTANPLKLTTIKKYIVDVNSDGEVTAISVWDDSNLFNGTKATATAPTVTVGSINDIKASGVQNNEASDADSCSATAAGAVDCSAS